MRLIYVMDPMCAWCYGFQPELEAFINKHPSVEIDWIMGGLAPDNNEPMDENLKQTISSYWHQIEERTQVKFNHDYWALHTPYRSTYPACRAVIAAQNLTEQGAQMAKSIQSAYYQDAQNPSLEKTLINCASSIGLDENQFSEVLTSQETEQHFQEHLSITNQLQVRGFPALFYIDKKNNAYPLALGFTQTAKMEQRLNQIHKDSQNY